MKQTHDLDHCILYRDAGNEERLRRILGELKRGFAFLETLHCDRVVTFFGSARTDKRDLYYKKAEGLAKRLAKEGITVLTGGGPGIMEAANKGAMEARGRSVGINIYLISGERRNKYVKESVGFYYFFNRKIMLAYSAEAYIFFPGGYGTLDEFFEICNLVITRRIDKKIPIILIGKEFWIPLMKWLKDTVIKKHKALKIDELNIATITDDLDLAVKILRKIPKVIHREEGL